MCLSSLGISSISFTRDIWKSVVRSQKIILRCATKLGILTFVASSAELLDLKRRSLKGVIRANYRCSSRIFQRKWSKINCIKFLKSMELSEAWKFVFKLITLQKGLVTYPSKRLLPPLQQLPMVLTCHQTKSSLRPINWHGILLQSQKRKKPQKIQIMVNSRVIIFTLNLFPINGQKKIWEINLSLSDI